MTSIPMSHVETIIRDDGIVATYMLVETAIVDTLTNRNKFFYVIVLTELSSKKQNRKSGYTSKYIDDACSYVRSLCRNRAFKG